MEDDLRKCVCRLCLHLTSLIRSVDLKSDAQLCNVLQKLFPGMKIDCVQAPKACFTCVEKLKFASDFKNTVLSNELEIQSNTEFTLNTVDRCRLCLKQQTDKEIIYLFENGCSYSYKMIRTVTEIAITPLNFYVFKKPIICTECWLAVKNIYTFKKTCFFTEGKLQKLSEKHHKESAVLSNEELLSLITTENNVTIGNNSGSIVPQHHSTIINSDSNNFDRQSAKMKSFTGSSAAVNSNNCETDKNEANITGAIASEIKSEDTNFDFEFDDELFEEIFENEDVVEICVKKPRNPKKELPRNQKLNHRNSCYSNTAVVESIKNIETSDVNLSVKEEENEVTIIEKNQLVDSGIFDNESSDGSDAPLTLAKGDNKHTVQSNTTSSNTQGVCKPLTVTLIDCIKYNTQGVCKPLTVTLIDCIKYPSNLTKSTKKHNLKKPQDARRVVNRNKNVNPKSISSPSKPGLKTKRKRTSKHDSKLKRKIIRCGECEFVTSQKDIMTVHMEKHIRYSEVGHKCQTCQLAFPNVDELEQHLNSCGTWRVPRSLPSEIIGLKPQKCTECNFTTRLPQKYKRHMLAHSSLNAFKHDDDDESHDKQAECSLCHTTLRSNKAVRLHIRRVHLRNFSCDICHKEFMRNAELASHMLSHSTNRKFKCSVCQNAFKIARDLRIHMLKHSDDKHFICDICKKSFRYKSSLYIHTIKHTANRQFVCNICNRAYHFRSSLKSHMEIHTSKRDFKCNICNKCFKGRPNLRIHLQSHNKNRNFGCDVCEKKFTTKGILRMHKQTHLARKREFFCDICSKGFLTQGILLKHVKRQHNTQEKFVCDFCQKAFRTDHNLKSHNKVHYYDKNFACSNCLSVFNRHYMLDKHILESHCTDKNVSFKVDNTSFIKRYNQGNDQLDDSNIRTVFCEICEKHYKIKCRIFPNEDNKSLQCAHCEYKSSRKTTLKTHILLKHTSDYGPNNFQCFNCGSLYKTKTSLQRHMRKKHM